jgi:hypothetical protein
VQTPFNWAIQMVRTVQLGYEVRLTRLYPEPVQGDLGVQTPPTIELRTVLQTSTLMHFLDEVRSCPTAQVTSQSPVVRLSF